MGAWRQQGGGQHKQTHGSPQLAGIAGENQPGRRGQRKRGAAAPQVCGTKKGPRAGHSTGGGGGWRATLSTREGRPGLGGNSAPSKSSSRRRK
jgi:hypothetical protein